MSFRTGLASTPLCTLFLLSLSIPCPAQNATCTHWAFFNKFAPADINDWHTIVGSAQQSNGVFTGIGGCFVATTGWLMRRQALVPLRDPRLAESLAFENV